MKDGIDHIKVMWHCLINFHWPIESWNSYGMDWLPRKYNYKIWRECCYNNEKIDGDYYG